LYLVLLLAIALVLESRGIDYEHGQEHEHECRNSA
jgi:hypothetical protein